MSEGRIEGFVSGSTSITVSDYGVGVLITMDNRASRTEAVISAKQSQRLRRLLAAAEKRLTTSQGSIGGERV